MTASYPTSVKSFTAKVDNVDDVMAVDVNDLQDEVVAIETALGAGVANPVVQVVNTQTGALATGSTAIPDDDTIPQNTEGDEYMTLAITPKSATNKLKIEVVVNQQSNGAQDVIAGLFQDTTAGALAVGAVTNGAGFIQPICFTHYMTAGTTSTTMFKVRAGGSSAITFNGYSYARRYGGVYASSITITEIKV